VSSQKENAPNRVEKRACHEFNDIEEKSCSIDNLQLSLNNEENEIMRLKTELEATKNEIVNEKVYYSGLVNSNHELFVENLELKKFIDSNVDILLFEIIITDFTSINRYPFKNIGVIRPVDESISSFRD